jgi:hypothetical protein
MDTDPWKSITDQLDESNVAKVHTTSRFLPGEKGFIDKTDGEELTFLNMIRKLDGLPYSNDIPGTEKQHLDGEQLGDDELFKDTLKKAIEAGLKDTPNVIYNPGSGTHVSIATLYENTRTIFTDKDGEVEHAFIQHNIDYPENPFEFYRADMHRFELPEGLSADVTLIFNATYMTSDELDKVVAQEGIVLINDWHGGATYMLENCPNYQFIARVEYNNNDSNALFVFKRQDK